MSRTPAAGPRPSFLYIGASKAGSSWLYEVLKEHPEVFVPRAKDVQFFDVYYDRGIEWYLRFFRDAAGSRAAGELSHDYFLSGESARRIHEWLPEVRLIACLREPVEKTVSAYIYNRTTDLDRETSFEEYAARPRTMRLSSYYENLLPFYERFPREQILVLFFDELKADPAAFLRRVYEFIGVDSEFRPPSLHRKVLEARQPRVYGLAHLAYRGGQLLRQIGMANLVGAVKSHPVFERLFFTRIAERPVVGPDVRRSIRELYLPRYPELEQLIGRELPASWYAETPEPLAAPAAPERR